MSLAARPAPIVLPDPDGRETRLETFRETSTAVLVFLRHYGGVFCREHVAQLRDHEAAFRARGARLAAVGLGDRDHARTFRDETGIEFALLVDERREAYGVVGLGIASILHLLRRDSFRARRRARAAGHRQHRTGAHPFQLGGSVVLGPGDVDRYVHVSRTFGDNAQPAALLAALERPGVTRAASPSR